MKEKAELIKRIHKSIWEITLAIICTTSFILAIVSALTNRQLRNNLPLKVYINQEVLNIFKKQLVIE